MVRTTSGPGNFSTAQLIVGQRGLPFARAREMYRRRFAIEQPLRPIILEPMFANANRLVTMLSTIYPLRSLTSQSLCC